MNTKDEAFADLYDVAIVGGGIAGMATAARLQAAGLRTVVLEAHGLPGGCAGYFRRRGFAFDVGATTLVDFEREGLGGELLASIGMAPLPTELLPGYVAWLPDRSVTLHRDSGLWAQTRLHMLGDTAAHAKLWALFDRLARVFWAASRRGVKLPIRGLGDVMRAVRALGWRNLPLARYLTWTVGDALRAYGLQDDMPLRGLLSMLVEDTVHATLDEAPLINGVLGVTIRGAGLTRAQGGMYGFWKRFAAHYKALGGVLKVGTSVSKISGSEGSFVLCTNRGEIHAERVVSAVPASLTARMAPPAVQAGLQPYLKRDASRMGGALVLFLGVPEHEVACQTFTHHQLLQDYAAPLGDGNNMFISVSAPGDTESAPAGYRAVMISTHCDLAPWENLSAEAYEAKKVQSAEMLLGLARRVYPDLGRNAVIQEFATPRTYARFTSRPRGAVGGVRLTLKNSNQHAIPYQSALPGFWLCGDTTWPGLGTVACVLGSRIVAEEVLVAHQRVRVAAATIASTSGASSLRGLHHA